MIIIHLAAEGGFHGVLRLWAEADAASRELFESSPRIPQMVAVQAPEYLYNGGPDLLRAVLPPGWKSGHAEWGVAWLPSDHQGAIPSSDGIGARSGRKAQRLVPWAISTWSVEPRDLVTLVAAYARLNGLSAAWRLGEEWAFWRRVWEFAGALVVRQSYLPTVMETRENPSRWLPFWQPVYEAEDLRRHEQLAEAMPVVARAVRWEPKRKPPDEPQFLVRDIVARLVECLVWVGYMTDEVSRGPSTRWHRWG